MKLTVAQGAIATFPSNGILFFCFEDSRQEEIIRLASDTPLVEVVKEFIEERDDIGKKYKCWELHTHRRLPARYIIFVGLGKVSEFNAEVLRGAGAAAAQRAAALGLKSLAAVAAMPLLPMTPVEAAGAIVEGVLSGTYSFEHYKRASEPEKNKIEEFAFLVDKESEVKHLAESLAVTKTIMDGVFLARDLTATPSNDMTPEQIANAASRLGDERLKVTVMDAEQIQAQGMKALYSVGKGSTNEPRFIIMEYSGGSHDANQEGTEGSVGCSAPIVLVGKGLTFDSGGISIKPSENMGEMKSDMAGAAAVIAAIATIAKLGIKKNVVGLIPALENMPDGNAYKPGDVLTSLAGHTIEITNTDAEGRVALADALAYAQRYHPALIVDVATLTGACSIAVGKDLIAIMGNNAEQLEAMKRAAQGAGEPVWELPLWEGYSELIKSSIADVVNSGGRDAGTITAGLFLAKFVGDYPWLHLDIASTAWASKAKTYIPAGATGVGVRLLTRFISNSIKS